MTNLLLIVEIGLALWLARWFGLMALITGAAFLGRGVRRGAAGAPTTRFLVLVPAHDEAGVIAVTVRSCRTIDYPPDLFQVFVIADNCGDATASVAEAAGARVVVRTDPDRRSKGYALADFFAAAAADPAVRPFDAYLIVDADTSVDPSILHAMDDSIRRGDDFVQGYYSVRNADASWRTRMLTFAFSLANGVWLVGLDRLGLSVGLKGNGMCFRASALERFPWRAHGLVEDMEYAWQVRIAGGRVRFRRDARVFGEMVSRGGAGAASQRRRWEAGRRALRATFRDELRGARSLGPWKRWVYGLELDFPPLSRLVARLLVASLLAAGAAILPGGAPRLLAMAGIFAAYWAILATYLLSPLAIVDLPVGYLMSAARAPQYMIWKLVAGGARTPEAWIRTPREGPGTDPTGRTP